MLLYLKFIIDSSPVENNSKEQVQDENKEKEEKKQECSKESPLSILKVKAKRKYKKRKLTKSELILPHESIIKNISSI